MKIVSQAKAISRFDGKITFPIDIIKELVKPTYRTAGEGAERSERFADAISSG
jgi:hypothetical protein